MTSWEENLLSLDEATFSNLIKNYLISMETPYNKQEIIEKLSLWIEKEENGSRLVSRITEGEGEILSCLYYLSDVAWDKLPLDWNDDIRENMTERLLIYPCDNYYAVTPSLEKRLINEGIISFDRFLHREEFRGVENSLFTPDDRLLMGFLSYYSEEKSFFLNDGTPRRKTVEELQSLLPYPSHGEDSFFSELAELFIRAGLLVKKEKNLTLGNRESLLRFSRGNHRDRINYLASLDGPPRARSSIINLLEQLAARVPEGSRISRTGWDRLLFLLEPRPDRNDRTRWASLPIRLSLLGICTWDGNHMGFHTPPPSSEEEVHPLLVQPNGDIDAPPHTPFSPGLVLSCHLERGETYYHFRITRDSFEQGLRRGMDAVSLKNELEQLTGKALSSNLITTMTEWEKQLHSLRIVPATVLNLSGYPRKILENCEDFTTHVMEKIGDCWYLMQPGSDTEWRAVLTALGLTPFEERPKVEEEPDEDQDHSKDFVLPGTQPGSPSPSALLASDGKEKERQTLKDMLSAMELSEEREKEFRHRIERDVILFPEQMNEEILRQEVCKAGGLDFNSKLRLMSSTMEQRNPLLEIKIIRAGSIKSLLITPLEMHNSREESLLLYREKETGEEDEIAVRKILEVIKFHGSLLS